MLGAVVALLLLFLPGTASFTKTITYVPSDAGGSCSATCAYRDEICDAENFPRDAEAMEAAFATLGRGSCTAKTRCDVGEAPIISETGKSPWHGMLVLGTPRLKIQVIDLGRSKDPWRAQMQSVPYPLHARAPGVYLVL